MNPLESPWFFRLVEDEAKSPADRLLAVFRVTENWIAAPGIREALARNFESQGYGLQTSLQLKGFLARLATAAGVEKPEVLASHLLILLQGAILEELRNPELRAMTEARGAAQAVIAQSRPHIRRRRVVLTSLAGLAATVFAAFAGWQMLAYQPQHASKTVIIAAQPAVFMPAGVNPSDMEAVLNLHEQFERGVCPTPQLLELPQGQVTAYMNAINFRTPENPAADRENLKAFIAWYNLTRSTECYYAPKNGHTTVTWTKG
jgi:hypothetical protein